MARPRSPFLVGCVAVVWVCLFLVSWLHRACMYRLLFWGCVCGVCGTGLLFENYIVDASIFYKKQFPRNMNLDLILCLSGCGVGFCGFLENYSLIFCGQVFKSTRWMPWH